LTNYDNKNISHLIIVLKVVLNFWSKYRRMWETLKFWKSE